MYSMLDFLIGPIIVLIMVSPTLLSSSLNPENALSTALGTVPVGVVHDKRFVAMAPSSSLIFAVYTLPQPTIWRQGKHKQD
ncbi:hypothetical protein E2C01_041319 [Portunus trituberculatus]|uniref:Uncharacterized protein n=1 Tax=Portunus trituberculatus TaxID=210409 RepID=A0A5B7FQM5_PORTR|nr:hypothetical protein [Portunus trituberculatus]